LLLFHDFKALNALFAILLFFKNSSFLLNEGWRIFADFQHHLPWRPPFAMEAHALRASSLPPLAGGGMAFTSITAFGALLR
ncbi:MAG: hypothetical protein LBK66_11235, partial [Spirochaetaceae bacterium]|nr:hypothetical protein [Spirochaetaceae bacterium]